MEDYKKKYEDALNAARKFKNDCPSLWDTESNPFKGVFEELEDSNDDNIRKHLLNWFKDCKWDAVDNGTLKRNDIIAWLEKHKYTEEDLDKAYKCADEVQYRRGYEDAKKEIENQGEQKPTWSEEDERYYDSALWHIKNSCGIEGNVYNWFKSLRERMKGE